VHPAKTTFETLGEAGMPDDVGRFTAPDGTEFNYRRFSEGHGRTNEIHIVRPGQKKG